MTSQRKARFVVDRTQSGIVTLQGESGRILEVRADELPKGCRAEGAVLDVPIDDSGKPSWQMATRNREEEGALKEQADARLGRLRKSDPGGDVEL